MSLHKDDPRSLGGYRITDRLGAGGMGVVYRARSRSGREVAVKVVHAQYAEDTVFRARFRQEIAAVRKVSGAFTAPVVDADPEAVRPWMATQYVPAPSLAELIRVDGPLRAAEVRALALGLVEALRDIHRAGVVHRDLKPANVLMAEDGPRVIDFGISRAAENQTLTETGHMIGTPPFMSPEQLANARAVGPASDVFSLGALLVYAVTGSGPFDADSPYLTAYRVMTEEPALDAVGEPLRSLLARCLSKDPADRPGLEELAGEFAEALPEPAPGDQHTVTLRLPPSREADRTPTAADHPVPPPRRRRGLLPALTATAGALAVAVTAYLLLGPMKDRDTAEASGAPGPSVSASAASRWAGLPKGWQPWQTTLSATAKSGLSKPLGGTDTGFSGNTPGCRLTAGSLYCVSDGTLPVRIDARTGTMLWRGDSVPSGVAKDKYGGSLLGIADGVVLVSQNVTVDDGNDTVTLVAYDAANGKRLWTHRMDGEFADPVVSRGVVLTPEGGRKVTARSPRDGSARWTLTLPAGQFCGFYDADDRLYAECSDYQGESSDVTLLAVDTSDGSTRKALTLPVGGSLLGTLDGRMLFALWVNSEQMSPEDVEYDRLLSVDPATGAQQTVKLAERFEGGPTLAGDKICFAASNGQVTAASARTGRRVWQTATTMEQPGRPVHDPHAGVLYLASASGRVAALDTGSGTRLWESGARADRVMGGIAAGADVYLDEGALVVGTADGTVFSLDPAHPDRLPASA